MVCTEQGTISMPMVENEPEEIAAPTSPIGWNTAARSRTSLGFMSVS
jgi:hypothetical protein